MVMRTQDTEYGADYWNSFDSGAGYQDSVMWEDLAVSIKEVFCTEGTNDLSLSIHHLDVGCAYGYLTRHLRRRGVDSYGCDFSSYALAETNPDVRPFLSQVDVVQHPLPWRQGGYNLITCYETMEHIPEDAVNSVLTKIYDALQSGGSALFAVCLEDRPGWDSDPTHITIHGRDWWQEHFDAVGFVTDERAYEQIKSFYLYRGHNGIFALSKP